MKGKYTVVLVPVLPSILTELNQCGVGNDGLVISWLIWGPLCHATKCHHPHTVGADSKSRQGEKVSLNNTPRQRQLWRKRRREERWRTVPVRVVTKQCGHCSGIATNEASKVATSSAVFQTVSVQLNSRGGWVLV